jgi:hypothetical protein
LEETSLQFCEFYKNHVSNGVVDIRSSYGSHTVQNCIFAGNADDRDFAGAVGGDNPATLTAFRHCVFAGQNPHLPLCQASEGIETGVSTSTFERTLFSTEYCPMAPLVPAPPKSSQDLEPPTLSASSGLSVSVHPPDSATISLTAEGGFPASRDPGKSVNLLPSPPAEDSNKFPSSDNLIVTVGLHGSDAGVFSPSDRVGASGRLGQSENIAPSSPLKDSSKLIASDRVVATIELRGSDGGAFSPSDRVSHSVGLKQSEKIAPSKPIEDSDKLIASDTVPATIDLHGSGAGAFTLSDGFGVSRDPEQSPSMSQSKPAQETDQFAASGLVAPTVVLPASGGFDRSNDPGNSDNFIASNSETDSNTFFSSVPFTPDASGTAPPTLPASGLSPTQSAVLKTPSQPPTGTPEPSPIRSQSESPTARPIEQGLDGDGNKKGLNIGLIAGIAAAGLVVIGLLLLFVILKRHYSRTEEIEEGDEEEPPAPLDIGSTFDQ